MQICSTLHNNYNDNDFELLNFAMIAKVIEQTRKVFRLMDAA